MTIYIANFLMSHFS